MNSLEDILRSALTDLQLGSFKMLLRTCDQTVRDLRYEVRDARRKSLPRAADLLEDERNELLVALAEFKEIKR